MPSQIIRHLIVSIHSIIAIVDGRTAIKCPPIGGYNLISVFLGTITLRFVRTALIRWLKMLCEKPNNLSV